MPDSTAIRVRDADNGDLSFMVDLDREIEVKPWGSAAFHATLDAPYRVRVAEYDAQRVAFLVARLAVDEAELLRIAVLPRWRRRGVARALLSELIAELRRERIRACHLEVRVSNSAAIACYRGFGFRDVGRRTDYYRTAGGHEDALLMCLDLAPAEPAVEE
jgi:ribosomal-protein-alanine N-acetyltransferase